MQLYWICYGDYKISLTTFPRLLYFLDLLLIKIEYFLRFFSNECDWKQGHYLGQRILVRQKNKKTKMPNTVRIPNIEGNFVWEEKEISMTIV